MVAKTNGVSDYNWNNWVEFVDSGKSNYYTVADNVALKVLEVAPQEEKGAPIIFVAGWASNIFGWIPVLDIIVKHHRLFYLEFRDKPSSKLGIIKPTTNDFKIDRSIEDLQVIVKKLNLEGKKFHVMSSSLGSNIILDYLSRDEVSPSLKPYSAMVIGPVPHLEFRAWRKALIRIPRPLMNTAKKFVKWYMKNFMISSKEPEQLEKYSRNLDEADPLRIRLSAIAIDNMGGFILVHLAKKVTVKTIVVGASLDLLHPVNEIEQLAKIMPNAEYLDLGTNKRTHDTIMGEIAHKYFIEEKYDELLKPITAQITEDKRILEQEER
ncbi:MAG: alpha/beta fold hydrolase [Candidatus Kariarchaeaceae archaeon]